MDADTAVRVAAADLPELRGRHTRIIAFASPMPRTSSGFSPTSVSRHAHLPSPRPPRRCADSPRRTQPNIKRIAEPLAAPADWKRPAEVQCRCAPCRNLSAFLGSPTESVWQLKAAQDIRTHVEHSIQRGHCDLDCTTDRRGRPYTLVCTKNQAGYERRVRQRETDLANRQQLAGA